MKPKVDFNLPGFLAVVRSKGAERAALDALQDILLLTYKAIRGRK
jgi:hypothetical protein